MKKTSRAAMETRTAELERMAAVDDENVKLRLEVAEVKADLARANRLAECEKTARMAAEQRLKWIGQLAGSGLHPRDL
jgi:hypothetical protein